MTPKHPLPSGNYATSDRQYLVKCLSQSPWTLASLSRALGKNAAYLHQFLHKGSPKRLPEQIRHQIAATLGISHEWLLPEKDRVTYAATVPQSTIAIAHLDIETAAGSARLVDDVSEASPKPHLFDKALLHALPHSGTEHLRLLTVRGDSMSPELEDGDVILIDLQNRSLRKSGIFVLDDGHGLVVKRLEELPSQQGEVPRVRIISTNKAFMTYRRSIDEIRVLGRVIWLSRHLSSF